MTEIESTKTNPGRSISDKILKNTFFNALGSFWKMGISLAITPYIIAHVGIDQYGIWAIIGILTGYFGLLDFGIGASFVKYISEFYAKGEYGKINKLVSTGIIFYAVFALIILALSYFAIDPLLGLLHITSAADGQMFFIFFVGIALFGATNMMSAFGALQSGLQRMDVTNKISVLVSIPVVLGTVFFLENGYGLAGLMINNVIVFIITTALNIYVAYRLFPELTISHRFISVDMFKKLFGFGYRIQIGNISDVVAFQSDRLIIAFFLSTNLVGFYQLGSQIAQTIRGLPMLLISALLPAASEINAGNDRSKLHELYLKGSKYLMFVSFPLTFFTIAMANVIMLVWMGPGFDQSVWIIQILALGYLANLLCGVAVTVGAAIERTDLQMNAAIITIVANLVLCLVLVNSIGFLGVAAATAISMILGPLYYFIVFHREIGLSLRLLVKDVAMTPAVASVILALGTFVVFRGMTQFWVPAGRAENFLVLCLAGAAYFGIYVLVAVNARYFDQYDIDLMGRYLPAGRIMGLVHTLTGGR